jgi:tRNA (guanosine-2'-O-)-methyltransferase
VHWIGRDPIAWLGRNREQGSRIVGVELADEAIRLADLTAARERTIVVLGHEHDGIPEDAMQLIDLAVEIPIIGAGQTSEKREEMQGSAYALAKPGENLQTCPQG